MGVDPEAELDSHIFERIAALRRPRETTFTCTAGDGSIILPGSRRWKLREIISPVALRLSPVSISQWRVDSGIVHTLENHVNPRWHRDGSDSLWLGCDNLPTEVLCVRTSTGVLSCRMADIAVNSSLTAIIQDNPCAPNALVESAGGSIVPLETNILYRLHDSAIHRSATNTTGDNVERSLIGLY